MDLYIVSINVGDFNGRAFRSSQFKRRLSLKLCANGFKLTIFVTYANCFPKLNAALCTYLKICYIRYKTDFSFSSNITVCHYCVWVQ